MKSVFYYETSIGLLGIAEKEGKISDVFFNQKWGADQARVEETPLIKAAFKQLDEYLKGERQEFDLPLAPEGTSFQQEVWQALQAIPYGETRTYKEIAAQIGNPKACRAVGRANNQNPVSIIIPCHRVIGAKGDLVGYGGGLQIKEKLLNLEKSIKGRSEVR